MAREIELKLEVPRAAIGKAPTLAWLRELVTGPVKREKLTSVYFDTSSRNLRSGSAAPRRSGDGYSPPLARLLRRFSTSSALTGTAALPQALRI